MVPFGRWRERPIIVIEPPVAPGMIPVTEDGTAAVSDKGLLGSALAAAAVRGTGRDALRPALGCARLYFCGGSGITDRHHVSLRVWSVIMPEIN